MRRRLITVLLIFVAVFILTALASLTPIDMQTATKDYNDVNQTVNSLSANGGLVQYIFGNNFMITLLMFVPFIGPLIGFVILYNSGAIIGAEIVAQHYPQSVAPVFVILDPIAWMEFAAYSTAIAGSFWLSARIIQGKARHELANTAKFLSVCAIILFVSAVIEAALIGAA
jgi:uncharacterized membrane protein SpoIIM required for sporulation